MARVPKVPPTLTRPVATGPSAVKRRLQTIRARYGWNLDGKFVREGGSALGVVVLGLAVLSTARLGELADSGWGLVAIGLGWGLWFAIRRRDASSAAFAISLIVILAAGFGFGSFGSRTPSAPGNTVVSHLGMDSGAPSETRKIPVIPPVGSVDTGAVTVNTTFSSVSAVCSRSIVDADRSGAYACRLPGGQLADPCFDAHPIFGNPVCLTNPAFLFRPDAKATVSLLGEGTPLPPIEVNSDWAKPWFVRLRGGIVCGTPAFLQADTPNGAIYQCFRPGKGGEIVEADQAVVGWLFDYPDESTRMWTAPFKARNTGSLSPRTVRLTDAWR